jgi:hypothetical protein
LRACRSTIGRFPGFPLAVIVSVTNLPISEQYPCDDDPTAQIDPRSDRAAIASATVVSLFSRRFEQLLLMLYRRLASRDTAFSVAEPETPR